MFSPILPTTSWSQISIRLARAPRRLGPARHRVRTVIDFSNRKLFAGAALGAIVLAGAGGYYARASAEGGAVNTPGLARA